MSEDTRLVWDFELSEYRPLTDREKEMYRVLHTPMTDEVAAKVREAQDWLIKRSLENRPAAFSEDGEPLTREQATALTLVGKTVNWTNRVAPNAT